MGDYHRDAFDANRSTGRIERQAAALDSPDQYHGQFYHGAGNQACGYSSGGHGKPDRRLFAGPGQPHRDAIGFDYHRSCNCSDQRQCSGPDRQPFCFTVERGNRSDRFDLLARRWHLGNGKRWLWHCDQRRRDGDCLWLDAYRHCHGFGQPYPRRDAFGCSG